MVRPMAGWMILAIVLGVLGFISAVAIPVAGGWGMIQAFQSSTSFSLGTLCWILALCAIARGILRYGEQACNHYIAFKLLARIRDIVFGKLRTLAPAKLEGRQKGDLISLITSDVELLEVFYAHTISPVCIAVVCGILFTLYGFMLHYALGLLFMCSYLCVGFVLPVWMSSRSAQAGVEYRKQNGKLNAFVLESVKGLQELVQFCALENRQKSMMEKSRELAGQEKQLKVLMAKTASMTNTLITLFTLTAILLAYYLSTKGELDPSYIIAAGIFQASTFGPFVALANLSVGLAQTLGAGSRLLDLLAETPVVKEVSDQKNVDFENASVKGLSFAYEGENILNNFSMDIHKGELIGIQGKSGCGKSTLLKLLMRFWDPQSGKVEISQENIQNINTDTLRDIQSYMTQETSLFHNTIAYNLKIANQNATQEQLEEACQKAAIHDLIVSLPDGYNTQVGELGSTLSGGERQRLGLARVFLHNAPFVLLDEPTSNLDALNEGAILRSIDTFRKDKTVMLVSHRAGTLAFADRIMRMERCHES